MIDHVHGNEDLHVELGDLSPLFLSLIDKLRLCNVKDINITFHDQSIILEGKCDYYWQKKSAQDTLLEISWNCGFRLENAIQVE